MTRPPGSPEDLFRAEKERALSGRDSQHARLLAEAKAAFDKLMAEGQAARKSGRPRKHPLPPLKTSSSRTPSKFAAPQPAGPGNPAVTAPVPALVAPTTRETKPVERAAVKRAEPAAKSGGAGGARGAGGAKSRATKAPQASAKSARAKAKPTSKRST